MSINEPSSPVCYAGENQPPSPESTSADSIKRWRRQQREYLLKERINAGGQRRRQWQAAILTRLQQQLKAMPAATIGFYWPFKGEVDCRRLVGELLHSGWRAALPAVVERAAPLAFYAWTPTTKLVPGVWKIPVPETGEVVQPDVLLVPLVGFDGGYYRLGYGGGYYDRTIASLPTRPHCIGIGFELARLPSIYPQPHDIPMDSIFTESMTMHRHQGNN